MLIKIENDVLDGNNMIIYGKSSEILPTEVEFNELIYSKYSKIIIPQSIVKKGYEVGISLKCIDCIISDIENPDNFKMIVNHNKVMQKCTDIWTNPEKYTEHTGDDIYYKFLRSLWIKYPDGTEKRLADLF